MVRLISGIPSVPFFACSRFEVGQLLDPAPHGHAACLILFGNRPQIGRALTVEAFPAEIAEQFAQRCLDLRDVLPRCGSLVQQRFGSVDQVTQPQLRIMPVFNPQRGAGRSVPLPTAAAIEFVRFAGLVVNPVTGVAIGLRAPRVPAGYCR